MSKLSNPNLVLAITINEDSVGGDMPIIFAKDEEDMQQLARHVANIMHATVHDLGNGTLLIVQR
ncbi:capping complex subunit for YIEGIA [Desulforamulus aquiferis]|uniref:capping complex subunit for YIEGIA n=1 Tax=Desulforamulus aquiferis TaxID=1397668 RepID=UPI00271525C8|nr:hypothetical protein [Desulforamulus aquiferis]